MDHNRTIEEASAAMRESIDEYWQALAANPTIEPSHQVNLSALASRYHVDMDVADLDAAIEAVNICYCVEPPIQRLGKIVLEEGAGEIHLTSAEGLEELRVRAALNNIAIIKMCRRSKNISNSETNTL